ncbi:MAG: AEC family transporter, partial [Clostridium sp.]|nr:AEC family transporter [Clostridium sp.]
KLTIFSVSLVLIMYLLALLFVLKIEKSNKKRCAMIQAIYRSNFVLMGFPVAANLAGEGNIGITAIMVAIIVPLYNVLAVITLECFRGTQVDLKKVIKGILKNPLILGAIAGLIFASLDISMPKVMEKTISQISASATPMALIVLGASFNLESVEKEYKNLIICVMGRLILVPAVALSLAALIGIRGVGFITLIGIFASPCAVSSYTMAQQMDSDGSLAGNTVIFTSAIASFTLFVWIFLFKQLGMF